MAAGEYVSVQSQADTQQADLRIELAELQEDNTGEQKELAAIYIGRGVQPLLASLVAAQLMAHDALAAHARDELGISTTMRARPAQAALASAGSFAMGAAMPLCFSIMMPGPGFLPWISGSSLLLLALLGALAARVGGAPILRGALRVMCWGTLAMTLTAIAGSMFGG